VHSIEGERERGYLNGYDNNMHFVKFLNLVATVPLSSFTDNTHVLCLLSAGSKDRKEMM
jgi:hypothetical protein